MFYNNFRIFLFCYKTVGIYIDMAVFVEDENFLHSFESCSCFITGEIHKLINKYSLHLKKEYALSFFVKIDYN